MLLWMCVGLGFVGWSRWPIIWPSATGFACSWMAKLVVGRLFALSTPPLII